jgi:hypothetical protein
MTDLKPFAICSPMLYVIRRHGGFFRPRAAGYTQDVADAGLFRKDEADRYADVEGLTIHPVSDFTEGINREINATEARLARLCRLRTVIGELVRSNPLDSVTDEAR